MLGRLISMVRKGELPRPVTYAAWGVGGAMAILALVVSAHLGGIYGSDVGNDRPPVTLASLQSKVQPPVGEMPEQDGPRYLAWLGRDRFEELNDLLHWTALAAAMSPDCVRVTSIVLSAAWGDRDIFVFIAECSTAQADTVVQFHIYETEAVRYREALRSLAPTDSVATIPPPRRYEPQPETQPEARARPVETPDTWLGVCAVVLRYGDVSYLSPRQEAQARQQCVRDFSDY